MRRQPLKYHGGKFHLAKRIVALMPSHLHFCEPFFGGGAVLLAKDPRGVSEVVNDCDKDLVTFWTVLRNPDLFPRFVRACEATPFSEELWNECARLMRERKTLSDSFLGDPVNQAWAFFVLCRQSLAGRMDSFTGVTRTRLRSGMNNEVSAWLTAVEGLPAVHERLKRVLILSRDALEVIAWQDGPDTLQYLDPPYLHETRKSPGVYAHEMSDEQHASLLALLGTLKGKFLLSGYRSAMYDQAAEKYGWRRVDFDIANHAAAGASKARMTECLWLNYDPPTPPMEAPHAHGE